MLQFYWFRSTWWGADIFRDSPERQKVALFVNIVASFAWEKFFSIWIFFQEHSQFTGNQRKEEAISLTPPYHYHPLHKHLEVAGWFLQRAHLCTRQQAESNRKPWVSERKLLNTSGGCFCAFYKFYCCLLTHSIPETRKASLSKLKVEPFFS